MFYVTHENGKYMLSKDDIEMRRFCQACMLIVVHTDRNSKQHVRFVFCYQTGNVSE